jgi:site-specific DNA-methyltransferase (adenine-specific)/modification methylase
MLEINQIHHGDCLALMPSIPDKSIDMILCDLPYGTTSCEWDSIIDMGKLWQEILKKQRASHIVQREKIKCL